MIMQNLYICVSVLIPIIVQSKFYLIDLKSDESNAAEVKSGAEASPKPRRNRYMDLERYKGLLDPASGRVDCGGTFAASCAQCPSDVLCR